jgi:transposase
MQDSNTTTTCVDEVFVGVDWGGSHHQLCAVSRTGQRLRQVRLGHDVAGLQPARQRARPLGSCLPVSLERSEGLLVEHLQARGHRVFAVNPRIAARARSATGSPAARTTSSTPSSWPTRCATSTPAGGCCRSPSPALAELRALSRDRDRLLESQQRVEAQLRSILDAYHPRR